MQRSELEYIDEMCVNNPLTREPLRFLPFTGRDDMANKKTSSSNRTGEPKAGRPRIPREYGVTSDKKGLLPWSHVNERMTKAMQYWVCTVSPEGRPHATPVDGLWLDGRLYFGGSPKTRWTLTDGD